LRQRRQHTQGYKEGNKNPFHIVLFFFNDDVFCNNKIKGRGQIESISLLICQPELVEGGL
jgi:hypothetical protein